ncbi:MAG: RNA 2',3'-cyclic phosphodiesterase [Myxococcales bacterium]|nr:RNA 2',3'-cyclic phosphodiesterase [Myxococcales bacterium]
MPAEHVAVGAGASSPRLFVAVAIEPSLASELSSALQQRARAVAMPRSLRWLAPDTLHFTLKFLGATESERVEAIGRACGRACEDVAAFELSLEGLGAFPSARRARVLWVGVGRGGRELCELAGRVERELETCGFAAEERPYAPHLSVARLRQPADLRRSLVAFELEPRRQRVSQLSLFRSHLSQHGARYEELGSWPLRGVKSEC